MADVSSSGQKRIATNDGRIVINQGSNSAKVEATTKAVSPPSQGGQPGDIQKAIDRIRLLGGVVTLRNGTYIESADITIPSNVTLVGESFGGVTIAFTGPYSIKASGSSPYSTGTIALTPGSATVTGTGTSWSSNLTSGHKIKINGLPYQIANVSSDTSLILTEKYVGAPVSGLSYLAAIFADKVQLENIVIVSQAGSSGIVMQYTDLATFKNVVCPSPSVNGLTISDSARLRTDQFIIDGAGVSGIKATSTDYMNLDTTVISNCASHNVDLTSCTGVVFTSCPSNGSAGNGYNITSCSTIAWMICQSDGNDIGINLLDSSDCIFNGGDFSGNTVDGVQLSGTSSGNIINAVIARGNADYGINIVDPSCANNRITGCQLLGNGSGDINDGGTNTVIIQDANPDLTNYFNKTTDDSDDITEGISHLFLTTAERTKLSNTSGTNTGDQTLPVKATGAEIDTGTDDAKFATPKAMEDSSYIKQAYADGLIVDSIADSDTTHAPSRNAVFDALALKQPLDSDLTTIAGLTPTTDNFMVATSGAWASRTPTQARTQLGLGSVALLSTITEADITLADNTTNNFSTTKHGFVPKGTNTGKFLKDDGTWASVPGGGDALTTNPLSQFASTTSLQLKGVMSDETGSGALVFGTSPNITTPTGIVKGDVGLGSVDNTSDATKNSATADLTNKTLVSPLLKGNIDGWINPNETWTYASGAATNVGTFTIAGVDLTGKYQPGDRVKFTQTTVKYGIITKVAFSTDTTVTIYMGTDYTIANATISANYYSKEKSPQGFPMSPTKWTETLSSANDRSISSASYTSLTDALTVPIGAWRLTLKVVLVVSISQAALRSSFATLSSDASTETNPNTTIYLGLVPASATATANVASMRSEDNILLTSATTFTLMGKLNSATNASGNIYGSTVSPTVIRAISNYL